MSSAKTGCAEANVTCVRCVLSGLNPVWVRWLYVQANYSTTDAVCLSTDEQFTRQLVRHFFRIWCQHNDADWRAVSADVGQRRNLLSREPTTMAGLLIRELIMRIVTATTWCRSGDQNQAHERRLARRVIRRCQISKRQHYWALVGNIIKYPPIMVLKPSLMSRNRSVPSCLQNTLGGCHFH